MEKSKIIKIVIVIVVAICAIIYYCSSNQNNDTYDNILTDNLVTENITEENKIEETSKIKVYITGEVNSPGVIELEEGDRIEDAVEKAGGITAVANLKDVNLAYEVSDGEKIYIPNLNEVEEESLESSETSNSSKSDKVNINKATIEELKNIPGVGDSTAQKIIDYREENGKFSKVEDIKNVSGIGDSKYEKMKDYISTK